MRKRVALSILAGLVLLTIAPFASGWAIAQPTEWEQIFGGRSYDGALSAQQTADGGYIVAGNTISSVPGVFQDVLLRKTDPSGNKIWEKTFGGPNTDTARSVQQTADGGYVLAGTKGPNNGDAWLIKTDSAGGETWDKTFGGASFDEAYSVQQTSDGYILAGSTYSYGAGDFDAWLIKTDLSGNKIWDKTFGGAGDDRAYSVQQTSDGYILAGYTSSYGAGSKDGWLIKTDLSGNKMWDKTFGGAGDDDLRSVQKTADGGYILAGHLASIGQGYPSKGWLIKTDASGNKTWDNSFYAWKAFTGMENYFSSVQQTTDGGYIAAGNTNVDGHNWILKTDSSGSKTWDRIFGLVPIDVASGPSEINSVKQTVDGDYIMAGFSGNVNNANWLIKVSAPQPLSITSITPNHGISSTTCNVTITGSGFNLYTSVAVEKTAAVTVDEIEVKNVKVISDTKITCTLPLFHREPSPMPPLPGRTYGVTLGKYDVTLNNGRIATLAKGFTVTNLCGQSAGVAAVGFGLMMGLLSLAKSSKFRRRLRTKRV